MTARRLIELSAPRPPGAPPIPLRAIARPGGPTFLMPPIEDLFDVFWLTPIICEGLAPMPPRIFVGMPRIFAESTALGRS
jgi:hypothetical protein